MSPVITVADYAASFVINSDSAIDTARQCLIDALARGFEALRDPECAALIGPLVPGAVMPGGARVPGTSLELDPAQAAFCLGVMFCRSASREHWLALRCGHAADSLGAILATADYRARKATMQGTPPPKVRDVLATSVKAMEIQGVLAREDGYHQAGMASLRLARIAATAVATAMLGGTSGQIASALSYAYVDSGMSIDTDEPDVGRRDRATADAISRAVRHACQAMAAGHSSHLTALDPKTVDLADGFLGAKPSTAEQPLGTGVIDRLATRGGRPQVAQLTTRFRSAVERYFPARQAERIKALFATPERLDDLPVNELLAVLVTNGAK